MLKRNRKTTLSSISKTTKTRRWFSAQSYICGYAVGKPKKRDKYFDANSVEIEERVCLFLANSFTDAMQQAKKEASEYCKLNHRRNDVNRYGQRLKKRVLAYNVYEPFDKPAGRAEIFSTIWITGKKQISELLTEIIDEPHTKVWDKRLRNFLGTKPN